MAGPRAPVGTLGAHVASAAALSREQQRQNSRFSSSAPAAFSKKSNGFANSSSSSSSSDESSSDSDSDSDIENGETSLQFQNRLSQSVASKVNGAKKATAATPIAFKSRTQVEEVAESPENSPPKSKSSKEKTKEEIDETPLKSQSRKDVIQETPTKSLPSKSPTVNGLKDRYQPGPESTSEESSSEDESESEDEDKKGGAKVVPKTKPFESESDSESSEDDSKSDASEDLGLDAGSKATGKNVTQIEKKKVAESTSESSSGDSESESGESESESDSDEEQAQPSKVKPTVKSAPKSTEESSDSESSSEESESESEDEKPVSKTKAHILSKKVAKSVEESSSGSEEESGDDSSSSSDENGSEASSSGSEEQSDVEMADESFAITTRTNGEQALATVGQVPELIAPDFHLRKAGEQGDAAEVAEIFRDAQLNGKQIWYFTAPASAPITAIEDMEIPLDESDDGKPVMSHNGVDYSMAFDDGSAQKSVTLVIPNATGDKYTSVQRPVDRVIHFQRTTTFIPGNGVASSSRAIVPATKPPRPQPDGLRVRFTPLGVPNGGATKSILKAPRAHNEDTEMTEAPKAVVSTPQSDSKKKRKHPDEDEELASQDPAKTPKSEKKKSKKLRLEEEAASSQLRRKSTTPIPPPVINGMPPSSTKPASVKQTPVLPPTPTWATKPSNGTNQAPASSPPPTKVKKDKTASSKATPSSQPLKSSTGRQTPVPLPNFPPSTSTQPVKSSSELPEADGEKKKRKRHKIKTEETD